MSTLKRRPVHADRPSIAGIHLKARSLTSWLVIGVAGAVVILTAVGAAVYPSAEAAPGGFDWVTFVFTAIVLAAPLVLVGLGLRSSRRGVARATAVLALVLAVILAATLLGHAFWGNDWAGYSTGEKMLDLLVLVPPTVACLAACLVELPSFTRTRPVSRA